MGIGAGFPKVGIRLRNEESGRLLGVLYVTFFAGLGGSSSSLSVRSMTSDFRLVPVRGAVEESLEDSGGVRVVDNGLFRASLLMLVRR